MEDTTTVEPPESRRLLDRLVSVLLDLAKYASIETISGSPFAVALYERTHRPQPGDIVIECSSFRFDPDRIGVFIERLWDMSHPLKEKQPEECYLWRVESLVSGEAVNWGNSEWLAVPTKELRNEVSAALAR